MAVAGVAVAGGTAQLRPHQRQRQLTGQQFVEGQPRPERAVGQNIRQFDRHMDAVQRFRDRRKLQRRITSGLIHSGSSGNFCSACAIARRKDPKRQAFRQRIDRIDTATVLQSLPHRPRGRDARSAGCRRTSARCRTRSVSHRPAAVSRRSPVAPGNRSAPRRRCRRWHRPDSGARALRGGGGRWRSTVTSSVTTVPGTASRIFGRARRSITLAGRCSRRSTSRGVSSRPSR